MRTMEEVLTHLARDASAPKMGALRQSCEAALALLEDGGITACTPASDLREKCLEPLQTALESRAKRLAGHAVAGLQQILVDERFQSSFESENNEEKLLPVQILNAVYSTPNLPEDIQVEIIKLLLNMTFSATWCMNAKIITKVCQVYVDTYVQSSQGVKGAIQANMTQVLSRFAEKLADAEETVEEDGDDVLADFRPSAGKLSTTESLMDDVVSILKYLCDKLIGLQSGSQTKQSLPLILEGIHAILSQAPQTLRNNDSFQELVWKHLCPTLISLLGTPKAEKSSLLQKADEMGRGSGCSSSAPNILSSAAKVIYSIAAELVRLVGNIGSLRPVLESLFHRMLLYPPPQHRHDALKVMKELLGDTERVIDLAAPPTEDDNQAKASGKTSHSDVALLKLIVDSVQECIHCNDSGVCFTSVMCVDQLLGSLERLSRGEELSQSVAEDINKLYPNIGKEVFDKKDPSSCDGGAAETPDVPDKEPDTTDSSSTKEKPAKDGQESDGTNRTTSENSEGVKEYESESDREMDIQATIQSQLEMQLREEMTRRQKLLRERFESVERQNAQEFIQKLQGMLPQLLTLGSVYDVDEALQKFASDFCAGLISSKEGADDDPEVISAVILNADGVYIAAMMTMILSLRLSISGYYTSRDPASLVLSEKEFMDDVLSCGVMVFLSPSWLSEVYNQVTYRNILDTGSHPGWQDTQLVCMLRDIDGLGSHEMGGQMMSSCRGGHNMLSVEHEQVNMTQVEAGMKLSRRILSVCWEGVLDVLSVLLNGKSSCGVSSSLALMLGTEGAKEESMRARDAICLSLSGLQRASKLCCILGLQERCGSAFTQLANTSCVKEDLRAGPKPSDGKVPGKTSVLPGRPKLVRLHAAHVLSMDVVMTTGLEMGSHAADCWKHVFRCCAHISELEHTYFSGGNNQSSLPKVHQEQNPELNANTEIECDLYASPVASVIPVAPRINVAELIRQSSVESGWDSALSGGGVLTPAQASKALCGLSQEVDRIFEDAAEKLNLQALLSFLAELGEASRFQLRKHAGPDMDGGFPRLPTNALHLYRLQEVLMKVVHSSRPLQHLVRVWSVISPYLVDATGSRDRSISKMAVTCIHDFIVAILSNREERPHFHINEFLCKTFEDMLCMDLCDGDVQDQIVCSICELVEACTAQIQSGWRPLFGALRSVKIEYTANEEVNEARQRHVAAVLDVFEVYLNTDNVLVFANATVDCILCLLKYVNGPGMFEEMSDDESDSGSDMGLGGPTGENLCIPALQYLRRCCQILASMWKMPACPNFKGAQRIQLGSTVRLVDPVIPNMNFESFSKSFTECDEAKTGPVFQKENSLDDDKPKGLHISELSDPVFDSQSVASADSGMLDALSPETHQSQSDPNLVDSGIKLASADTKWQPVPLDELDNPSRILHVWFLLLDGLATSISSCPKTFQPQTMEMLFELLRSAADVPGPRFAVYNINHLLLPMLQSWLRRGSRIHGYWEVGAVNFKQCCGNMSDLVVEYLSKFIGRKEEQTHLEFMLKQTLDVLTECAAQPVENISRLGCSCLRHVMLSGGPLLTEEMWQMSAAALQRALDVTTFNIRQLMVLFHANSENFYGDIGQVKVATRKDCTKMECFRLKQLAQQVFLLESQMSQMPQVQFDMEEDQSYVFLLYPPNHKDSLNPDHISTRVPFRNLVVGLLSHQLLLQTVGYLLLEGTEGQSANNRSGSSLTGLISCMSTRNVLQFLDMLHNSYKLACDFDTRPGLKFLIQKVAGLEVAANLYKHAGSSIIFYIHSLLEICAHLNSLTLERTRSFLDEVLKQGSPDNGEIDMKIKSRSSVEPIDANPAAFIQLLQSTCDELCQTYVDILLDKDGMSCFDRMADQSLFFLIAQPDDASEMMERKTAEEEPRTDVTSDGFVTMTTVAVETQEESQAETCPEDATTPAPVEERADTPSPVHTRSKRELREEHESKVYTVATDKFIQSLMSQYKRRKQQHSMPSFVKFTKRKKDLSKAGKKDGVDDEIDKQQKNSILKDSEAHVMSWSEMLCTILRLFLQLPQPQFRALLPAVFNCVNQLICHAEDPKLKETLADWFYRLGSMYGFSLEKAVDLKLKDEGLAQSEVSTC
ncbi:brefeldin A-inhibited guanine nucleotide-exchange protein 3-like [Haliotis cracherodii]|uniref:brefeldin A-inhibited guanine nucleotide-exchange protein 3-like n=1 Tax=Haliotis cracherodii TaxID=6455 RepID=UPI0039ECFA3C